MSPRRSVLSLLMVGLFLSLDVQAYEEKVHRYALVIGIQNYTHAPLLNPVNDARSVAGSLRALGFDVTLVLDAERATLQQQVRSFYESVSEQNALTLFYYAGHAVQLQHHNYLVPLQADLSSVEHFSDGLYDVNDLFAQMPNTPASQNLVILDACRNNPFASDGSGQGRASGLAPMRAPVGTLIAYATEPGGVASDGQGKHSTYTRHLLKRLDTPVPVEDMFRRVRRGVSTETRGQQIPWEHSSLLRKAYINPPKNEGIPDIVVF